MSDFWAVLVDLFNFARETLVRTRAVSASSSPTLLLAEPQTVSTRVQSEAKADTPPFGMVSVGYVMQDKAIVLGRPLTAFDTVVATLTYGTKVDVVGYHGRFVNVKTAQGDGWLLKDAVTTAKTEVWPVLETGATYLATDRETELIRAVIKDEFFATELYLPLRTEELVTYRLREQGRYIPWGSERPRLAGLWHELLKGKSGIFMSLEPKTGSIMEAYGEAQEAFLAYVLAVHPDNTLLLESVGQNTEGEYLNETVPKSVWQTWRPVFIAVT